MVDMHPLQAYKFLRSEADAVLVDVRSELEYFFVGHAEGALHIPWHVESGTEVNLNFIESLLKFESGGEQVRKIREDLKLVKIIRFGLFFFH